MSETAEDEGLKADAHPLLLLLEEHLTKDRPDVLDDEGHLLLHYSTNLLVALWKSMDTAVGQMIEAKNLPMAIRTLGALGSKVNDLKKFSYNNYKNLKEWHVKINQLQRRLKRQLAERGPIKG